MRIKNVFCLAISLKNGERFRFISRVGTLEDVDAEFLKDEA